MILHFEFRQQRLQIKLFKRWNVAHKCSLFERTTILSSILITLYSRKAVEHRCKITAITWDKAYSAQSQPTKYLCQSIRNHCQPFRSNSEGLMASLNSTILNYTGQFSHPKEMSMNTVSLPFHCWGQMSFVFSSGPNLHPIFWRLLSPDVFIDGLITIVTGHMSRFISNY